MSFNLDTFFIYLDENNCIYFGDNEDKLKSMKKYKFVEDKDITIHTKVKRSPSF